MSLKSIAADDASHDHNRVNVLESVIHLKHHTTAVQVLLTTFYPTSNHPP